MESQTIEQLEAAIKAREEAKEAAYQADLDAIRAEMAPYVECAASEIKDHGKLKKRYAGYLDEERRRCHLLTAGGFDTAELTRAVDALAMSLSDISTQGTRDALAELASLTPDSPALDSTIARLKHSIDLIRNRTFRSHIQSCVNNLEMVKDRVQPAKIPAYVAPIVAGMPDPNHQQRVIKSYDIHKEIDNG